MSQKLNIFSDGASLLHVYSVTEAIEAMMISKVVSSIMVVCIFWRCAMVNITCDIKSV